MGNFVTEIHEMIRAFVEDHPRLRPGTGSYSTPFRGSLFGEHTAVAVAAKLDQGERVDILFLGSNPNVPRSLNMIQHGYQRDGDWNYFETQVESGLFGDMNPDAPADREQKIGWDPIHAPKGHWKFFADEILGKVTSRDRVAMMNAVPWGSADFASFLKTLRDMDEALLRDVLTLSERLLMVAMRRLRPKVLLAPFSLVDNKLLNDVCEGREDERAFPLALQGEAEKPAVRSYRIVRTQVRWGELDLPMVCMGHPSALRYQRSEKRKEIAERLRAALGDALGTNVSE